MGMSILKQRHKSYDPEDFVQDSMSLITKQLETKSFANIKKLKCFINTLMKFHYTKEKRKYYHTYKREGIVESFEDPVSTETENLILGDTLSDTVGYDKIKELDDSWTLKTIQSRNLYVYVYHGKYKVIEPSEIKQYSKGLLLSINNFIQVQRDHSRKETCTKYKLNNFRMSTSNFEQISQIIIDYMKDNNLISFEN
jgi:hypothetical protein